MRQVVVSTFDLDARSDVENLEYQDIPEWDSIGHMSLVVAIEDEFDVQLDTDQVIDMSSFAVAVDMLRALGVDG